MPVRLAKFKSVESSRQFPPFEVKTDIEFTIFNITQEKSKEAPHNPYLKFEFKQVDGNRKAWRNFSLLPQSLFALKRLLVDLGEYDEDKDSDEDTDEDFEFEPADLMGRHVFLQFGPEKEYNGNMTQEVVKVTSAE